ncbi:DUF3592 domain-containing protein [Fibrella sp. HMF5335]|uniref:DUF3592 domain-containing protein n=1 Tax=Fibrella rubiginis TaxID=2817060 RepID=A0A939GNX6_9BACT|nr:DUF3592 domain-containing protein [Fibrella rubiginis]MBO0939933.1 DUF3592 domain-containing protein [Fibrella rubiginis]
MNADKFWLLFLTVFSLVGVICSGIAYWTWSKNRTLKANGVETTGVVVDLRQQWKPAPNRSTALAVVVQYTDAQQQPRVYYSQLYTTPPLFQPGETVRLWYRPEAPNDVLLEGKDEWLIPAVLAGFGLVFSLIGLPGLVKALLTKRA